MNKDIMIKCGFGKEVERLENKQCPMCGESTANEEFKNEISKREFKLSGLCQQCQDKAFAHRDECICI